MAVVTISENTINTKIYNIIELLLFDKKKATIPTAAEIIQHINTDGL